MNADKALTKKYQSETRLLMQYKGGLRSARIKTLALFPVFSS